MKGTPLNDQLVDYMIGLFPAEDALLSDLKEEAAKAELPPIQISPEQAAFMGVLLKAVRAKKVIEIGTLGGYSAIVMARALPEDGSVVTIEVDPFRAEFAREQIRKAGLEEKITIYLGPGIDILERTLADTGPYDFAFIDADKESYLRYLELLYPLMRPGGVIAGDNALAWGEVADAASDRTDVQGIRAFNQRMSDHPGIDAAILPIGDGMCIGVVKK